MKEDLSFYVYILFDAFAVPRYVGKGKNDRWLMHELMSDTNWQKNEFIEQTWILLEDIPKIKVRENISEKEAYEVETMFIKAIGIMPNGPLTNMTYGGGSPTGWKHTAETRALITASKMGHIVKQNTRELLRLANLGKIQTEETKEKRNLKLMGLVRSETARTNYRNAAQNRPADYNARCGAINKANALADFGIEDPRSIREALGLSVIEFAAIYGFAWQSVYSWERKIKTPRKKDREIYKLIKRDLEAVSHDQPP